MEKRDTQFAGFAELLFNNLPWGDINIDMEEDGWEERWETYIAQRIYDLACHILSQIGGSTGDQLEAMSITPQEVLADMPELDPTRLHFPEVK